MVKSKLMNKKNKAKNSSRLTKSKKRVFWIILIMIPIFILVSTEALLHLFNYGDDTKLFVSTPNEESPYYGINTKVAKRYFYSSSFVPTPRKDLFLKEKPKNGYRIFVLGGSTAAGYPYGNNITFSRILNRRLNDIYSNKSIEIINLSMTAINSYTMIDFMDEILDQNPDAILIYAGHNEFYGALGVSSMESLGKIRSFVKIYLKLQNFKLFQLIRKSITDFMFWIQSDKTRGRQDASTKTAMANIVDDKEIILNGSIYELGKEQFKQNISEILSKSKDAGINVVLSELVSNIKDQEPFVSIEKDTIPPANLIFNKAKELQNSGDYNTAKKLYYRAKDLDALRFRASEEFNDILHELAEEFDYPIVKMRKYFEERSPNGLIGYNLMHEHLHPNLDGYFLMAEAFFNKIMDEKIISDSWDESVVKPSIYYEKNWGLTEFDKVYAEINIKQLKGGWPFNKSGQNISLRSFKPVTLEDTLALQVLQGKSTAEMAHIELANHYSRNGNYLQAFKEYLALIYTVPNLNLFYEPMVELILKTKQFQIGYKVLSEAVKFNRSDFIHKWLGQFSLTLNHTEKGIHHLEIALKNMPNDLHILVNLTRAYYKLKNYDAGDIYLGYIRSISPNSPYINSMLEFKAEQKK